MVKVMSFAIQEGKMAVHCHAGLGRTGVLLACYLVFTARMSADQAILFVRAKRPNSIQTRGQLLCVREFAAFLVPLRSVFACAEPAAHAVTLCQYLTRQRHLLHGYEARQMKNVPKIVRLACRRLLDVAADRPATAVPSTPARPDLAAEVEKTVSQQALQQLGKEMRGKGIPMVPPPVPCLFLGLPPASLLPLQGPPPPPPPTDNHLGPPWSHRQHPEVPPLRLPFPGTRRLSYSDSALDKLAPRSGQPQQGNNLIKPFQSHTDLSVACDPLPALRRPHPRDPDTTSTTTSSSGGGTPSSASSSSPTPPPPLGAQEVEGQQLQQPGAILAPVRPGRGGQSPPAVQSAPAGGGRAHDSTSPPPPLPPPPPLLTPTTAAAAAERGLAAGDVAPGGEASVGRGGGDADRLQSDMPLDARRLLVARALAMDLRDKDLSGKVSVWQEELNGAEGAWERLCAEQDPLVLSGLMWSWLEQLKEPSDRPLYKTLKAILRLVLHEMRRKAVDGGEFS
ncbi:hypothetical protein CRUP_032144 [Coryphaenoides rupestris]|nr:hypothetical protein CRUP_032144 [Coryphaenoides rupestris]